MFERMREKRNRKRSFCGYNAIEMKQLLDVLYGLEDESLITEKEQKALEIAINCMTWIINRMLDGKRIYWD